ncbi:hypothetical protein OYC64_007325, partial [Pagothenia borchgrevinki]
QFKKEGYL